MKKVHWTPLFTVTLALCAAAEYLSAQERTTLPSSQAAPSVELDGALAADSSALKKRLGSPYVPLDSWIYPALERLAALGYIHSQFSDLRPWTRLECARLLQEAAQGLEIDPGASSEAQRFYAALQKEFQSEFEARTRDSDSRILRFESFYTAFTGIRGRPLNDSYHFGQTIINNYGRPYQEGFSSYDGFSAYAVAGRFTIYARGEFQHAPSAPAYPLSVRQVIAAADDNPLQPAAPIPGVNQFRLLDTYASANLAGWNLSFGKQSLWWAPNYGGALLFSNNAEPIYMARVSRNEPFRLPWIFRLLGPMKWDLFFGKLSGNQFPPRPLVHGEKISFKPTANLEVSFSRTAEFGGVGRSITMGALFYSYFSFQSSAGYSASQNPGERSGGFDFSYRIPGLRNWITVYGNLMSRDDPNPLDAPRRASWNPGLYLAWVPYVPRLDFRVEAVSTNPPSSPVRNGQFNYWEGYYHDLNTNKGNLIGHWVGREGMGFQAWSTYWFSPTNTVQFGYRHAKVDPRFIPGGETLNDASVALVWRMRESVEFRAFLQRENWVAPILAPTSRTNWTSSVQISFRPKSFR